MLGTGGFLQKGHDLPLPHNDACTIFVRYDTRAVAARPIAFGDLGK